VLFLKTISANEKGLGVKTIMITKEALPIAKTTEKKKAPLFITDWLNELEEKRAKEFFQRTGLEYQTMISQIIEAADLNIGSEVLELEACSGAIARHLVNFVGSEGKIIGVDSSAELVERARLDAQSAKVSTRLEWRVAPYNHLPFDDERFDVVTCGPAFNQLDALDFFRETFRVLREGGELLVAAELAPQTGLSDFMLKARKNYYRYIKRNEKEATAHFYNSHELTEMLRATGFRQIIIRGLKAKQGMTARSFSIIKAVR
jgi:ubiquinone/menaquinone biosynthesis C-methylase UbiE